MKLYKDGDLRKPSDAISPIGLIGHLQTPDLPQDTLVRSLIDDVEERSRSGWYGEGKRIHTSLGKTATKCASDDNPPVLH